MSSPLKVLYMLHDSRRSGVPAVAANIVSALDCSTVHPTVLFAYDGIYAQELRGHGVEVVTLGNRTPFLWRAKRFLMNGFLLLHARNFDAVHLHSIKMVWSVLVARWLGAKVVFHLHEMPRRIGWLLRYAIAQADCAVFCSETCADHFAGVPAREKRTIVNAMRFPEGSPVQHEDVGGKVVMVASINKNKGQDLLLQAFARLKPGNAELWFYGTTGLSAHRFVYALKQYAREHGVADRVHFPGPTPDVFQILRSAAVLVHTSWTESFGMALVEAQACGVPVIAHDLEGMREVVEDGVSGFLVEPGNVDELVQRLDALLAAPAIRNRMGGAGYAMVRERFSIAARIPEYHSLYREVCAKP